MSSAARSAQRSLRVVLCIMLFHPFLWLFLFALLYHAVKDFFLPILHYFDQFCSKRASFSIFGRFTDFVAALSMLDFARTRRGIIDAEY